MYTTAFSSQVDNASWFSQIGQERNKVVGIRVRYVQAELAIVSSN